MHCYIHCPMNYSKVKNLKLSLLTLAFFALALYVWQYSVNAWEANQGFKQFQEECQMDNPHSKPAFCKGKAYRLYFDRGTIPFVIINRNKARDDAS